MDRKQLEEKYNELVEILYNRYLGQFTTKEEFFDLCKAKAEPEFLEIVNCVQCMQILDALGDGWCCDAA